MFYQKSPFSIFFVLQSLIINIFGGELIRIPNFIGFQVTPQSKEHMVYLNKLRTEDSGVWFINGIGVVGEGIDVLTTQEAYDWLTKDLTDLNLHFEPSFSSITLEMSNDDPEETGNGDTSTDPPANQKPLSSEKMPSDSDETEMMVSRGRRYAVSGGIKRKSKKSKEKDQKKKPQGRSMDMLSEATGQEMVVDETETNAKNAFLESGEQDKMTTEKAKSSVIEKAATDPTPSAPAPIETDYVETFKQQFVDIEPIIEPNVYSGVLLQLSSFSTDHKDLDKLSFGVKVNSTMGNPYLCLSTTKTEDNGLDSAKEWIFEPTEEKGYYTLRNSKMLNGYVSWEDDEEQYLVIEMRKEAQRQFKPGGHYRKNALFKISKNNGSSRSLELAIMGRDGKNIHTVIDPTWAETTGCYLLRRTDKVRTVDDDTLEYLFRIRRPPGSLKIFAMLENLKYKETVDDLYQRAVKAGTTTPIATKTIYNHGDYQMHVTVKDIHERRDKFQFSFKFHNNNSMTSFDEVSTPAGLGIATMGEESEDEGDTENTDIPAMVELETTPGVDTIQKFKYKISGGLHVPPRSSLTYTLVFGWMEKLKMLYEAELKIFGKTKRLTKSNNPKIIDDQIVSFRYVQNELRGRGFSMMGLRVLKLEKESVSIFIDGGIVAKSLGIRGDIEVVTTEFSKEVYTDCKM